jgi:hypothetical protein
MAKRGDAIGRIAVDANLCARLKRLAGSTRRLGLWAVPAVVGATPALDPPEGSSAFGEEPSP